MPVHPSPHGSSMDLFGPVHPNGYQINIILKKGTGHDFVSTDVRCVRRRAAGARLPRLFHAPEREDGDDRSARGGAGWALSGRLGGGSPRASACLFS